MTTVLLGDFDRSDDGGLHGLIRRFRAGDAEAFATVLTASVTALRVVDPSLSAPPALVPVPGHDAGSHAGVRLALAREIARALGWAVPMPVPLCRVHAVEPARSRAAAWAGAADEARSLAWDDTGLDPGAPIVLLDDVVRSGGTLDACAAAIRRDGTVAGRDIRAVALARAVDPAPMAT